MAITIPRELPASRSGANSLSSVWTIAQLTIKEALRRRFWLAAMIVCLIYIGVGFLPTHLDTRRHLAGPQLFDLLGAFMASFGSQVIEFFGFLFAVSLSAGALSAEIDKGTLAVIVPKPLPRWSIYAGKLLGVNLFIAPLIVLLTCILQWAIWMHIHETERTLWATMLVMLLYPLVFSSLTLFFSSFAGNLLSTILPLIMASAAWSEGTLKLIGYGFNINSVKVAAKCVVYIAPLNPLSRWHERALNLPILQQIQHGMSAAAPQDPPANYIDLAWILIYALIFFIAGMMIFRKRDL